MEHVEVQLNTIRQIWLEGEYTNAYTFYESLLKLYPQNPLILCDYGLALYAEAQDMERATELLTNAHTLRPGLVKALLGLGELYAMGYGASHERKEVLPLFQRVIDCLTCDKQAKIIALTQMAFLLQTPGERIRVFQQAIQIDPLRISPHHNLVMEFCLLKDFEKAQAELKIVLSLSQTKKSLPIVQENLTRIAKKEPCKTMYMGESVLEAWFNGETEGWELL